jgi:MoxR-like ATPase
VVREAAPDFNRMAAAAERVVANVEKVIEGKREVIRLSVIALLAEGHLLIEDIPGVGKTMLAKALARSLSCEWRRIQFTPDLLPSDVTGVSIYDSEAGEFVFKPGPVFANIVLGDEVNRASPKTQSALLECMEERQVSVDGVTHALAPPFMVIATQNPLEHEGTYTLPESQLDRFMMRLAIGYPDRSSAMDILERHASSEPIDGLEPVLDQPAVLELVGATRRVHAAESVKAYVIDLVEATRADASIFLGASPRASLFLLRAARAKAVIEGRDYVLPDDVKQLAPQVLSHRLLPSAEAQMRGLTAGEILAAIVGRVPAPSRAARARER